MAGDGTILNDLREKSSGDDDDQSDAGSPFAKLQGTLAIGSENLKSMIEETNAQLIKTNQQLDLAAGALNNSPDAGDSAHPNKIGG